MPVSPLLGFEPRQKRGVEARERAFQEAMRQFGEKGVQETRVEDIVAAAGLGWGTFYRYFPRKQDVLLTAAVRYHIEHVGPLIEAALADPDRPARDIALQLFLALLSPAEYPPHLTAAVLLETIHERDRFVAMLGHDDLELGQTGRARRAARPGAGDRARRHRRAAAGRRAEHGHGIHHRLWLLPAPGARLITGGGRSEPRADYRRRVRDRLARHRTRLMPRVLPPNPSPESPMSRRRSILVSLIAISVVLALAACGSSGGTATTTAADTNTGTYGKGPAAKQTSSSLTGLRNVRYCEIIPVTRDQNTNKARIYNTIGLNNCPEDKWKGVTEDAVDKAYGAQQAKLNGPRYWVLDSLKGEGTTAGGATYVFNGIDMAQTRRSRHQAAQFDGRIELLHAEHRQP